MSTLQFTDDDRDENGRIRIEPPAGSRFTARDADEADELNDTPAPRTPTPRPPRAAQPRNGARTQQRAQRATIASGMLLLCAAGILLTRFFSTPAASVPLAAAPPAAADAAPLHTWTPATATTAAYQMQHAVVVYASPAGEVIGAIEPGRGYVPVAQYGAEWVQLSANDSGLVWVRRADVYLDAADRDVLATLPDLAQPTSTPVPTSAPPTFAPVQQPAAAPPAPTVCASNIYGIACGTGNVQATADAIEAAGVATSAAQRATLEALPTPTQTIP